jgi:predicted O-linked N-acetylglucosamine transferase (SPINDLY family)
VLLDLCGHTMGNRMGTLHNRPAPVQASLIVFPGSLGMSSVPWRITDSITDPPSEPWLGPERLVNIDPCFFAYAPLADAPELSPPPCESTGVIAFGSFSSLQKWTDATVRLYAGVLRAVPNSRLLVRNSAMKSGAAGARVRDRFGAAGISSDRLTIEGPLPGPREAMADYARMDIALDTFPYHGMTTTCESLWMGVPMVVLGGSTPAARVGCSLLRAVGVQEMLAATPEEYVTIAARLAGDHAQLRRWRSGGPEGLRARMAASALCDGAAYCRRLENAVAFMWREFCATATSR